MLDSVILKSTDRGGESFWSLTMNALSRSSIQKKRWWKEVARICLTMEDSGNQETFCLLQESLSMLLNWKITCMAGSFWENIKSKDMMQSQILLNGPRFSSRRVYPDPFLYLP